MHSITIVIPGFLVTLVTLILAYPLMGMVIGVLENTWVSIRSSMDKDKFFNQGKLKRFAVAYPLLWPVFFVGQFMNKVIHLHTNKITNVLGGDQGQPYNSKISRQVRYLKAGDTTRYLSNQGDYLRKGSDNEYIREGKIERKFDPYNCSYLVADGRYIRLPNGKASTQLSEILPLKETKILAEANA